jgi:HEAT repeat protein
VAGSWSIGDLGDPAAVEPLIEALRDPFVDVQWLAAKSLGKIGDPRAVGPLLEAIRSEDKWLRVGAAWGLGKLRDPRAVEPLILLLKDTKKMVRRNAAWALGTIMDKRAVPALTELLKDADGEVRETAKAALASISGTGTWLETDDSFFWTTNISGGKKEAHNNSVRSKNGFRFSGLKYQFYWDLAGRIRMSSAVLTTISFFPR